MSTSKLNQHLEKLEAQINKENVDTLFQKYDETGFIYEAKRKLLEPFMTVILENWKKISKSKDDLLWIVSNSKQENCFASISAWRQTNYGLFAQHLVSNGNPFISLKVMLAAQIKAELCEHPDIVNSSQNWFRPENRYAFRVFSSMVKKLGPEKSSLKLFHLLKLGFNAKQDEASNDFSYQNVEGIDQDLIQFVDKEFGNVFTQAEEIDLDDISQEKLQERFAACGLTKTRRVIKFMSTESKKVVACLIANRAPVGLNFSFLENRCYYIIDSSLPTDTKNQLLKFMNGRALDYYKDIEIAYVPVVADESVSELLQDMGANFLKKYLQSIWLRAGFRQWYEHINSFLQKIEKREARGTVAQH